MAKPKNIVARNTILSAARRLRCQYGYDKTSYSLIAKEAGCTKTLVQQYFPQKAMFYLDFNECLRAYAIQFFRERGLQHKEREIDTFVIGQIYYCSLISPRLSHLFRDIIRDRDLMRLVEDCNNDWMLGYLETYRQIITKQVRYSMINSIGGLYEVLYYFVNNNETDYSIIMPFMINSNYNFFQYSKTEMQITKARMRKHQLGSDLLEEAIEYVFAGLSGGDAPGQDLPERIGA